MPFTKEQSSSKKPGLPKLGFVLLAYLTVSWGIVFPIMKIALREIRPWTFRSLCLLLGGLGALAIARAKRMPLRIPRRELRPLLIVSFFGVTLWHLGSAVGLTYMEAGRAAIIAYTMPVWASVLAVFILRERFVISRLIGLLLGMAALAVLIGTDIRALGSAPVGGIFVLGAGIAWAVGTVLFKYYRWSIPLGSLTAWQLLLGAIPVLLGTFLFEPVSHVFAVSLTAMLATGFIIFAGVIMGQWAWLKLVRIFPASVAAIGTLTFPIMGVFSSALLLGEKVGLTEISALVLLTAALAIVLIRPNAPHDTVLKGRI